MRFLNLALIMMIGSVWADSSPKNTESSILVSPNIVELYCVDHGLCLSPQTLTIPAGTTVTWYNATGRAINITPGTPGDPNDLFPPQQLGEDEHFSYLFDTPGHYPYYDAAHPWATGEVYVIASDAGLI